MHSLSGQKLIFMPGLDGTGASFEPLLKLIPSDIFTKTIYYPNDKFYSFEEIIEHAKSQIEPSQENIILAESFSGPIAITLIGSGQVKAKGLILCSTFARSPRPLLIKVLGHLPLKVITRFLFRKSILKYAIEGDDTTLDLYLTMWKKVNLQVPTRILTHRLKLIDQTDVRRWLPNITIPCCYIRATHDIALPLSTLLDFTETIPDLRVRSIRGPHFILLAHPHASLMAIRDFINLITGS